MCVIRHKGRKYTIHWINGEDSQLIFVAISLPHLVIISKEKISLRIDADYAYSNTCLITSLLWNIGGVKCIKNFVQFKHPIETFSAIKGKLQDISKSFRLQPAVQIFKFTQIFKFLCFQDLRDIFQEENPIQKRIFYDFRLCRGWKRLGLIVYYKHILEAITHIIFTLDFFRTKHESGNNVNSCT